MGGYDGYVRINTKLDTQEFDSGANKVCNGLKKIGTLVIAAFSVKAIVSFGKACTELASDLAEVDNVVQKSFGSMRGEMDALANVAIKTLGMSRLTAYQTGSTFMAMGKSMLDNAEDAKVMALELTKLTGNMASFYNKSQDLVSLALKSVYTGETETLKQYGIVMTEANLKQFALSEGITKTYNEMTQSEKVMLRYQYVMKQTSFIGNDFIDTQDSWANQTRILKEQWKEFMSVVGTGLITVLTPLVKILNSVVGALITFANAVGSVLSNVFGIQMQELSASGAAAEDVAGGYSDAADAAENYGNAAEKSGKQASKAAKEASKSVASFDTIKKLSDNSSKGSSGGGSKGKSGGGVGGGGGSLGSTIDTKPMEKGANDATKAFEKFGKTLKAIIGYLNKLKEITKLNFELTWKGLDVSGDIQSLITNLQSIGTCVAEIFSDEGVQSAASNFVESFAAAIGSIAASITDVGVNIANLVVGGIAQWLESDKERIKKGIVNLFDVGSAVTKAISSLIEEAAKLTKILTNEKMQKILADLISIVTTIAGTVSTLVLGFAATIIQGAADIIEQNMPQIETALTNLQGSVETVTGTIKQFVQDLSDGVLKIWDEHLKPFIDDVIKGVSSITKKVLNAWNKNIAPIITEIGDDIQNLYDEYVKPIMDNVLEIVGDVIDIIKELWNNVLVPVIGWVSEKVVSAIAPVLSKVWELVGGKNGAITQVLAIIKSITTTVKDVIKIVKGIIKNDWKSVWESAKSILKGIAQGIVNIIFGMANKGIDALNGLLSGLRTIANMGASVVNKLFGTELHISTIPHIKVPQLAQGAVIPPNAPFLAMLGDQTNGTNIETPLDTMIQAFKTALNEGNYNRGNKDTTVILQLDQTEFARAVVKYGDGEKQRVGVSLI